MARRIAVVLAGALVLAGLSGPGGRLASAGEPPLVRAVSRAARLPQLAPAVARAVAEIDGPGRGRSLIGHLSRADHSGSLQRFALELQSLLHERRGNYLYALYCAVRDHDRALADRWAERLATMGVAVGVTSGHFTSLAHLDPEEPLPESPPAEVARTPIAHWVDAFESARYRLDYRPFRRGALSEVLQLRYRDGTRLDIDIRVISDNREPAVAQAVGRPYVGPAGRLFPLRLGRDTTPRLWRAKHELALAAMHRSNRDFEDLTAISVAAVTTTLPLGLVTPVSGPAPRASVGRGRAGAREASTGDIAARAPVAGERASAAGEPRVPTTSRMVRRPARAALRRRTPARPSGEPPSGPKPPVGAADAARWRYQRYVHGAVQQGKEPSQILPFATWRRRYYDTVVAGGRPGRPGGPAHKADVARNNGEPNRIRGRPLGRRYPDGVGRRGQTLVIRGREIAPRGQGRVIVESDHVIRNGTMPDSAARAQVRDIRRADPSATIVVTDQAHPKTAPLVYPPGTQPPPPGRLPLDQAPVVPYP